MAVVPYVGGGTGEEWSELKETELSEDVVDGGSGIRSALFKVKGPGGFFLNHPSYALPIPTKPAASWST